MPKTVTSSPPLSVGMASECELMDFRVTREVDLAALPETLNAVSPEGVRFLAAYEPERKAALIKWLRVRCEFEYDSRDALALLPRLEAYFSSPNREIVRIEDFLQQTAAEDKKQNIYLLVDRMTADDSKDSISRLTDSAETIEIGGFQAIQYIT